MLLLAEAGSGPRGVTAVITIRGHHWRFCSVDMENNVLGISKQWARKADGTKNGKDYRNSETGLIQSQTKLVK